MRDMDAGKLPDQVVRLNVSDPVTGDTWPIALDITEFMHFYELIKSEGIEQARRLAVSSLQFARQDVTDEEVRRISAALWEIQNYPVFSKEEFQLRVSYHKLRAKKITREQAAEQASTFLNTTVSSEAWRKRVDRWADDQGYPAIGQTKRRPRSKVSGHG